MIGKAFSDQEIQKNFDNWTFEFACGANDECLIKVSGTDQYTTPE